MVKYVSYVVPPNRVRHSRTLDKKEVAVATMQDTVPSVGRRQDKDFARRSLVVAVCAVVGFGALMFSGLSPASAPITLTGCPNGTKVTVPIAKADKRPDGIVVDSTYDGGAGAITNVTIKLEDGKGTLRSESYVVTSGQILVDNQVAATFTVNNPSPWRNVSVNPSAAHPLPGDALELCLVKI